MNERRRRGRLGAAAGITCVAVLAFGVLGGTGLAGSTDKPAKAAKAKPVKPQGATGQSRTGPDHASAGKVTLCHKGKVTLSISANAVAAHQARHGDTLGACAGGATATGEKGKSDKAKGNASGEDDEDDDASKPDDD